MSQRSIEVKVGMLILVAMALLGAFVVVMGGLTFEPTYTVYVDFENPGALQSGAPVRIAGVKVGKVDEMQFRGGIVNDKTGEPAAPIRAVAKIEKQYQDAIHENARFFVTSQGVLGEMFLAIEPGSHDRPALQDGAIVDGVSPPRLDLLLSESYALLHRAYEGITENDDKIGEMFDGLHATLKGTGRFFDENEKELDQIVHNVEELTGEANETIKSARTKYVDNPRIDRIIANVDRTTTTLNRDLDPMMRDGRKVLSDASRLTETLASEPQLQRYEAITEDVEQIAGRAKHATADAQAIVAHVKRGKGSVGAFVMDEAVYDDIQELLRDLKHNPWKLFWRE